MTDESEDQPAMVSGRTALRVRIHGASGDQIVRLMEDTTRFLRSHEPLKGPHDAEDLEMSFKRPDLGDFVIVSATLRSR
ncbi:hypothetical protein JMG10_28685 [Nostoc ellipsosporum NOK]|uniref:hypothetical protein n=1 Tax=Sphingomonas sp. IBVSS2 TaxID=1985172 RepID=UPI000A2E158F|nr:hypothetical protein [Sphingomonas sp. IBVSS2]MDF2385476.1 hypothetical protein [Nostoc ellipsosporum NOK]OSZ68787.1 hypothetical protein CAP40_09635 [Sphingomonas sp. IBVSS2]